MYKPHDRDRAEQGDGDEIVEYLEARSVGAAEAVWRLLGFQLHGRSHCIERLPVHLEETRVDLPGQGRETATAEPVMRKSSKLEAWFRLNREERNAAARKVGLLPPLEGTFF